MNKNTAIIPLLILVLMMAFACGCQQQTTTTPTATPATATKTATATATASPAATDAAAPALKNGDSVAAPWGGGWYLGTIQAVKGDTADVLYSDDKQVRQVKLAELFPVTKKTWKAGDKVMAVWTSGKFYNGEVQEVKPNDTYVIKWEDGSTPSDVTADKIITPVVTTTTTEDNETEETPDEDETCATPADASPAASPAATGAKTP